MQRQEQRKKRSRRKKLLRRNQKLQPKRNTKKLKTGQTIESVEDQV